MEWPASIGIVMHDFPLGGTERIALRLARAWIARGVAVTIFCGDPGGPLADLVPDGARLVPADPPIPRGRGSRERLGRAAARFFSAEPVEGLFVTGNFHWEVLPALSTLPATVRPAIVAQISSPIAMPQRGWLRQMLFERRLRRLLCHADALVAMDETSRDTTDRLLGSGVTKTIPLPALDDDAPPPSLATGRTIVAAGRLIHQKGFDLLIDALAKLDDPSVRLTIVGSGPEEASLRRRIEAHGLTGRVQLAGFAPDIRPFLDSCRLFVLPSRFEGYGAVILEALDAGRPVIATRSTPAVADVLTEPERGIAIPIEDVGAMTSAIRTMLDRSPPDPMRLAEAVSAYRIGCGAEAYLALFSQTRTR